MASNADIAEKDHLWMGTTEEMLINSFKPRLGSIDMNRTTSTLISIGVSAVLIAVGVWFFTITALVSGPGTVVGQWANMA